MPGTVVLCIKSEVQFRADSSFMRCAKENAFQPEQRLNWTKLLATANQTV